MQTFLPYADSKKSAECLDKHRCIKQVVEAWQIRNTINSLCNRAFHGVTVGWQNHPAVKMWMGHEAALLDYYNIFWEVCKEKWGVKWQKLHQMGILGKIEYPPWFGNEKLHSSHRANLLRKDIIYYGQFGWTEFPFDEKG